ncbi:MAG: methionine adenosyltransferase domain-containing protein [Deltaproteobacteria bacterium]|nr:methionine adenosyltransferase domain-containing protein [Deltaproteobacteria bacterium]
MTTRIETAEHVLPGHPDKLCDAAVDALVDYVRQRDPYGQCGLEAACVRNLIVVTGRIAADPVALRELNVAEEVRKAYLSAGYGEDAVKHLWRPLPVGLGVVCDIDIGPFLPEERDLRHLSDDQAICVGHADASGPGLLPPAVGLARAIAQRMHQLRAECGAGRVGPDGKVLVTIERNADGWRPTDVSMSLHHAADANPLWLRQFAERAVASVCPGELPRILVNGGGSFACGGPHGDNGLAGKKLVVDGYGPQVPIGGGAWSGKDFRKVDRLGGLLARQLAVRAVRLGLGERATVTLHYHPGSERPAHIALHLDGVPCDGDVVARLGHPDVDNLTVWQRFVAAPQSLVDLARWGHQQAGAPWEGV